MRTVTAFIYQHIIRNVLFLFPADSVHSVFLSLGRHLGKCKTIRVLTKKLWAYEDKKLQQNVLGLHFKNPVGLAAGFDYNADLVNILPSIGFGFNTVGTLTLNRYDGNPAPMLGRLKKSHSLIVNKGFKNESIIKVLSQIDSSSYDGVRGVSIGVTNKEYPSFNDMIDNLIEGFRVAEQFDLFDYYELNISCPNLRNIKHIDVRLDTPEGILPALIRIQELDIKRPILVKMPLEQPHETIAKLIDVIASFPCVKGLILSNLVKDRSNTLFDKEEIAAAGTGNFSGKPTEEQSNALIRFAYKKYHNRFILIGTGGVFSASDAYKKIRYGATLVQMITGMVYQGPQVVGDINQGLSELLLRDGYKHISEAVGVDA